MSIFIERGLGIRKPHIFKYPHTNMYWCVRSGTYDAMGVGPIRAFERWLGKNTP